MTPAEAAAQAAARHGLYLTAQAASDIAAAVLAAHDAVVTVADILWPQIWESGKEDLQRFMILQLLGEVYGKGAVPIELPQVSTRVVPRPDLFLAPEDGVEVRVSVRVRHVAGEGA